MSITVQQLTKIYGTQKAVNNISFTVNKGEIVGFLGPNGAGKSTTMKIITGYIPADNGNVEVCGIKVAENNTETKKKIGYLPEANPLYLDMYVREYLGFVANIHGIKNEKETIEKVIQTVGLTIEANKKIGQLSKGYKQRVGLAAALIHDPEVLILDEPTSGLDPNQIAEIREVIKQLGKEKTILFSSHILQEVEAICDRIIIINRGDLVADSTLQQLHASKNNNASLSVTFEEDVDISLLQSLKHASAVHQTGVNSFEVHSSNIENIRKQLMELCLKNNLNIVSLQNKNASLEELFRELTQKSNH